MRRLPENRMFHRMLRAGKVNVPVIDALARRLAGFHHSASAAEGWCYGLAPAFWRTVLGNLNESERFVGYTATNSQFTAIEDYLKGFISAYWKLFNDRMRQGHVRDGHGNLRCEHICLAQGIQIFDCLEFSPRLRYADVASDIAFLAMDLDSLGASRLADELCLACPQETADETFATLTNFYKCDRACVRGKVESLKSLEDEVPPHLTATMRAIMLARISRWRLVTPCAVDRLW
jgi:aminoglycoside phosphotransferase family enzyme